MERKLAAILAADVVGYSRLMEIDEAGTLGALKAHREALIDPAIAEHHGRIVKLMGDGSLVEFASVVDAVACALAIQEGMAERNAEVPEERRIEFRIGVHLGDVIVEGDDLYGDGVNVAARLEGLAKPGGICISQQAFDQVETKLDLAYEDLGEQRVKNITRPVHVYRIRLGEATGAGASGSDDAPPLPDKPSIAVLPFDNMSGDPEQEFFSDGLAEDIITALSKIERLRVIARHSTFEYKGQALDLRRIAEEVGDRLRRHGARAKTIALKLRYSNFNTITRQKTRDEPTDDTDDVHGEASELLDNVVRSGDKFRLIGISCSNLEEERKEQLKLFG